MAKTHKKQHYVPASYLKGWLDPTCPPNHDPYVWIFDKDGGNPHRRAPSNIFTETDLYTIEKVDGTRDLRLENGLSELEYQFSRVRISKFSFQRALTMEETVYLCAFVAAAQFRTPSSRDHHASQWGNVVRVADDLAASMAKATPEQRKAAAHIGRSSGGPSFTHEQVKQLAATPLQVMMPSVLNTVTPILMKMDMAIFYTDDPVGFITTDNPCVWFDPEAYKAPSLYRSPALGSKTIEVTIPISPNQCLCFNWHGISGYQRIHRVVLDELNRRHRMHSEKQYVVRSNAKNDYWFSDRPMPNDVWGK